MRKTDFAFWTFLMMAGLAGATTVLNVSRTYSATSPNSVSTSPRRTGPAGSPSCWPPLTSALASRRHSFAIAAAGPVRRCAGAAAPWIV